MATTSRTEWRLEVVRGAQVGQVYALDAGPVVLGNRLDGQSGIDLSAQEGASPRRMAGRQAQLEVAHNRTFVRDLDSPGGTFVNRQRILPGQARELTEGDVIQLGGVQLRFGLAKSQPATVAAPAPPSATPAPAPRPGPLATPFAMASGLTCRSWDDFLTASAQNWAALRDELTSGRLARHLQSVGRTDLLPGGGSRSPDEQLDAWLGRLPVTRTPAPELDVHPGVVKVRARAGGGTTRQKIEVTNTGYRLLRSTIRIEPGDATWLTVAAPYDRGELVTTETTQVGFDVHAPEDFDGALTARLVVESNGGRKVVEVRLERPTKSSVVDEPIGEAVGTLGRTLGDMAASVAPIQRLAIVGITFAAVRGLIAAGERLPWLGSWPTTAQPGLAGGAVLLAAAGGVVGAMLQGRRRTDGLGPAVFTGAFAGVLLAAVGVAASRAVEPLFGGLADGPALGATVLWAVIGVLFGIGSLWALPHERTRVEEAL